MARRYYVLVSRENSAAPWRIEFGDYDPETVRFERQELRDHGAKAGNLKILTVNAARQSCVDFAVSRLNGTI